MTVWHNDNIFDDDNEILPLSSRIRYGDGVFDTALVRNKSPMHYEQHIARLLQHAQIINLAQDTSAAHIMNEAEQFIDNNAQRDKSYVLNTYLLRAQSQDMLSISSQQNTDLFFRLKPYTPNQTAERSIIISVSQTRNEQSPLSRIKHLSYLENILALHEAQDSDAHDAIILNTQKRAACCTTGNLIALINNEYLTPSLEDGCIDGVLRSWLIEHKYCREISLTKEDLFSAQGIFLCNSVRGVQGFASINGTSLSRISTEIDKDFFV